MGRSGELMRELQYEMQLIGQLYSRRLILTWMRDKPEGWELTSGAWSPFYFMFRHVPFHPDLFEYSVGALTSLVEDIRKRCPIDALVGIASTGIPLAAGVALRTGLPLAYTRKVAGLRTIDDLMSSSTAWGQHSLVEGEFKNGMRYLLVDDVVTGGASKDLARRQVEIEAERRGLALEFGGIIVVVDRGYPGHDCRSSGVVAAHRLYDEIPQILSFGGTDREAEVIRDYLEKPGLYQEQRMKSALYTDAQTTRKTQYVTPGEEV